MIRRIYDGGAVVEEWDDRTRVYRGPGVVRPFTEAEIAAAVAREAAARRLAAAIAADRSYLDTGVPATSGERLARLEAQVDELTRQAVLLLRLVGGLDD